MAKGTSKLSKFGKHKSAKLTKSVKTSQNLQNKSSKKSKISKLDNKFSKANTQLNINELFKESKDIIEEDANKTINYDKLEEELISKFVNIDLEKQDEDEGMQSNKPISKLYVEDESTKDKPITEILGKDVLSIFNDVSELMKRYKSGKLPKPLRIITMLSIFEKLMV